MITLFRQEFAPQFTMSNLDTVFEESKAMYEYGKKHLSDETVVNSALFEDGTGRMIFETKTNKYHLEVTIRYRNLSELNDDEKPSAEDCYDSGEADGIKFYRRFIYGEGNTEYFMSSLNGVSGVVTLDNNQGEIITIRYKVKGYLGSNPLFPTNPKVLKDISQLTFDVDSDKPWVLI